MAMTTVKEAASLQAEAAAICAELSAGRVVVQEPKHAAEQPISLRALGPESPDTTPSTARRFPSPAALAFSQRAQMGAYSRGSPDSLIMPAVRKQMEALEEKLTAQITRALLQGDKLKEAALERYDAKMTTLESNHSRMDRRLAEISGNLRGLSDEMQCQIRRINQTDSRLWEWRHQVEEDFRGKLVEMEQSHQQVCSSVRVAKSTSDDASKRHNQQMLRMESMLEERTSSLMENLLQLEARLAEAEESAISARDQQLATCSAVDAMHHVSTGHQKELNFEAAISSDQHREVVSNMEVQLKDATRQMDQMRADLRELMVRMESQEERCKTLRTMADNKDEQYWSLTERIERENWAGRLRDLTMQVQEIDAAKNDHSQRIEIVQNKLECSDQRQEELGSALRRFGDKTLAPFADPLEGAGSIGSAEAAEVLARCRDSEEQLALLTMEVQNLQGSRADDQLGAHVASLVDSLKEVAPKVISHECALKDIQAGLASCQDRVSQGGQSLGDVDDRLRKLEAVDVDTLRTRVVRVEEDVSRLTIIIEGDGTDVVDNGTTNCGVKTMGNDAVSPSATE